MSKTALYPLREDLEDTWASGLDMSFSGSGYSFLLDAEKGDVLDLSGVSDYASVGSFPVSIAPFTITFWAKFAETARTAVALMGGTDADGWQIGIEANGYANAQVTAGGVVAVNISDSVDLRDSWYHLAYVERANNDRELYVDGSSVATNSTSATPSSVDELIVGQRVDGGRQFNGRIFDLRIFDSALSLSEIQEVMNFPVERIDDDGVVPVVRQVTPIFLW